MIYTIRPVERHDLEELVRLCSRHARYERVEYDTKAKAERLANAIFLEGCLHCWVVEYGNGLAGYCSFTFDYSTWDACRFLHMDCLYLDPPFRGKGIGEDIVMRLKATANENNCVNVQWQTPSFNESAIRFYKRIGATEKEKVRFFL